MTILNLSLQYDDARRIRGKWEPKNLEEILYQEMISYAQLHKTYASIS